MQLSEFLTRGNPEQTPTPFEVVVDEHDRLIGSDNTLTVVAETGQMWRRRAIKGAGSPNARNVEWCVVELNGVKVYVSSASRAVVVTTDDLLP